MVFYSHDARNHVKVSYDAILARSPFIIYQPGGTASGLIVTSWSQVQKFIAARQGACTVYVDDSIVSPALVPGATGITEGFGRLILDVYAGDSDAFSVLQIEDGATISNLSLLNVLELRCNTQSATPSLSWSATPNGGYLRVTGIAKLSNAATATQPSVVIPVGKDLFLDMYDSFLSMHNPAVPFFSIAAGSTLEFNSYHSVVPVGFASGPGNVGLVYDNVTAFSFSPSGVVPTLPALTGSYTFLNDDSVWVTQVLDPVSMSAPTVGDVPAYNADGTWHAVPFTSLQAGAQSFVFRPGAVSPAAPVYATWTTLYAAAVTGTQGLVEIAVDDSLGPANVDPGTWDLQQRVVLTSFDQHEIPSTSKLIVPNGSTLKDLREIQGFLTVETHSTTTSNLTFTPDRAITLHDGGVISNIGTAPVITLAANQFFVIVFAEDSLFSNTGAGTGSLVDLSAAGAQAVLFSVTGGGYNTDNIVTGVVGTSITLQYDATIGSLPTNPGFAGTTTQSVLDSAPFVAYAPAVPANWPVPPTQVAQALDELAAGSATSSVVWRPGGVAAGNVVTTAAAVQAAIDRVQGAITVYIDTSLAAANVNVNWNGYGSAQIATTNDSDFFTILDGFTLTNFASMQGLTAVCQCVTTQAFAFGIYESFLLWNFATISLAAGALVPAIVAPAGAGVTFAMFSLLGSLDNSNAPTIPVVSTAVGGWTTFYPHSSAFNFSFLSTGNEIGGGPGSQVSWENDDTVAPLASALFTGTLNQDPSSDAGNASYTAANVANWSGTNPTSIANALDRIAAKIGPIP